METTSEKLFMEYCASLKVQCEEIKRSYKKTMDYKLGIDDYVFITEVTEFAINPDEDILLQYISDSIKNMKDEFHVWYPKDENKIRNKIEKKYKQLQSSPAYPVLLVLYDNRGPFLSTISIDDVRKALFGDIQAIYMKNLEEMKPEFSHIELVGGLLTQKQNTHVSAFALLHGTLEKSNLIAIHNPYAENSLDKNKCKDFFTEQYDVQILPYRECELLKISF